MKKKRLCKRGNVLLLVTAMLVSTLSGITLKPLEVKAEETDIPAAETSMFDANPGTGEETVKTGITITGGTEGEAYTIEEEGLTSPYKRIIVLDGANLTFSGEVTDEFSIVIAENATANITFDNFTLTFTAETWRGPVSLREGSDLTIHLKEGSNNYLTSGRENSAIRVPQGSELTITGAGALTASIENSTSAAWCAVIGSQYQKSYGNINIIDAPAITIKGDAYRTAIGTSDWQGIEGTDNGNIYIKNSSVNTDMSIGGGNGKDANNVILDNANITSARVNANTMTVNGSDITVSGDFTLKKDFEIPQGTILAVGENQKLTVAEGVTLTNNGSIINSGRINVYGTGNVAGNAVSGNEMVKINWPCEHEIINGVCQYCGNTYLVKAVQNGETIYYSDITTAVNTAAGEENAVIFLLNDITSDRITVPEGSTVIDLNGYSWTASFYVTVRGSLTIRDSSAEGTGKYTGSLEAYGSESSAIRIEGGTFQPGERSSSSILSILSGSLEIMGGTFIMPEDAGAYCAIIDSRVDSVKIYKALFEGGLKIRGTTPSAVLAESCQYIDDKGDVVENPDNDSASIAAVTHTCISDEDTVATCVSRAVCRICKLSYGEPDTDNHVQDTFLYADNGNGTHTKKNECCGKVADPEEPHILPTAGAMVCTLCGAECEEHVHEAETNVYQKDETGHWQVCKDDGTEIEGTRKAHEWNDGTVTTEPTEAAEGEKTYTCTVCGQTRTETLSKKEHEHQWSDTWTKNGTHHWYECTAVGCNVADNSEKAGYAAHSFGDWNVTKNPTGTEAGLKVHSCTECGYEETVSIPAMEGSDSPTPTPDPTLKPDPTPTPELKPDTGDLEKDNEIAEGAPETVISSDREQLKSTDILTDAEKTRIENGEDARIWVKVDLLNEQNVPAGDKEQTERAALEKVGKDAKITYLDLTLWKQVGSDQKTQIFNVNNKIQVTITVPDEIRNTDPNKTRTYYIICVHDGKAEVIEGTYNKDTGEFTFVTDRFSTYAIVYKDTAKDTTGKPDDVPKTGDTYHTGMWFMLMLVSGMGAFIFGRRRKENME